MPASGLKIVTKDELPSLPRPLARLRKFGFPVHNARHNLELLGSCFKKYDGTMVGLRHPFLPRLIVATQFQSLCTDISCFLFNVCSRYQVCYRSGIMFSVGSM